MSKDDWPSKGGEVDLDHLIAPTSFHALARWAEDPSLVRGGEGTPIEIPRQHDDWGGALDGITDTIQTIGCDRALIIAWFHLKLAGLYWDLGMDAEGWREYLIFAAMIKAGIEAGCQ